MSSEGESRVVLQPVGNVVLVPLQGPVSTELFEQLRQELLHALSEGGAKAIVLDMRGIEVMDGVDITHLRRVVDSARLMGAKVILAEIRPGVAAGLALLDIDDSWITSARTVEKAMARLKS